MSTTEIRQSLATLDTYERRLAENPRWCLEEGGKFFEATSSVHKTLRSIAERLTELNIPYAICGGMALNAHGFRRFTEDVNILVTKESLKKIMPNFADADMFSRLNKARICVILTPK